MEKINMKLQLSEIEKKITENAITGIVSFAKELEALGWDVEDIYDTIKDICTALNGGTNG